jgi:hypothetical protein
LRRKEKMAADSESNSSTIPPFLKAWNDYAAACQLLYERLQNPAANAAGGIPLPFLESWKDFAEKLGMKSDWGGAGHFKLEDMFQNLLPALGHTREYQEIARRMLDLSVRFQQRYADFMQQSNDIGQSALSAMQKHGAADGTAPRSPAALYDAWIDCAEQAYAQAAHGEAFSRSLADLCNILSAFKIERGKMLEALARQLDLPSRAEVDSLHRQVRDLADAVNRADAVNGAAPKPVKPKARKPRKPREVRKPRKRTGK